MAKYRRKPVIVNAIQFAASRPSDFREWGVKIIDGLPFLQTPSRKVPLFHDDWIVREDILDYVRVVPEIFEVAYEKVED